MNHVLPRHTWKPDLRPWHIWRHGDAMTSDVVDHALVALVKDRSDGLVK